MVGLGLAVALALLPSGTAQGAAGPSPQAGATRCAVPDQVDLHAGFTNVPYLGPTMPVEDGLGDVAANVDRVWFYDRFAGAAGMPPWKPWAPILPGPLRGFNELVFGDAYFLISDADVTWTFPVGMIPDPPTSVQLVAGGNNVTYFGDPGVADAIFALGTPPVEDRLDALWRLDPGLTLDPLWSLWAPILPPPLRDFTDLAFARSYFLTVTEPFEWSFPPCVDDPPPPPPPPPPQSIAGVWTVVVTVTREEGVCSGELGVPFTDMVTITEEEGVLTVVGLGGPNTWEGSWDGEVAEFGGMRPEDGGTTTAFFSMTLSEDGNALTGFEEWTWLGPGGFCPNGESDVTAVRVS